MKTQKNNEEIRRIKLSNEQIYDSMKDANDEIITMIPPDKLASVAALIKNGESTVIDLELRKNNQGLIQNRLKEMITKEGIEAYVLILNLKATIRNKKTNAVRSDVECVLRTLYTPTDKVSEVVWFKHDAEKGLLVEKEVLPRGRLSTISDPWDAWSQPISVVTRVFIENKKKTKEAKSSFNVDDYKYRARK